MNERRQWQWTEAHHIFGRILFMKTSGRNDKQWTCTYHDVHVARTTHSAHTQHSSLSFPHFVYHILRDLSLFGLIKRKTEINTNGRGSEAGKREISTQCNVSRGRRTGQYLMRLVVAAPSIHQWLLRGLFASVCLSVQIVRGVYVCFALCSLPKTRYKCEFKMRTKFLATIIWRIYHQDGNHN